MEGLFGGGSATAKAAAEKKAAEKAAADQAAAEKKVAEQAALAKAALQSLNQAMNSGLRRRMNASARPCPGNCCARVVLGASCSCGIMKSMSPPAGAQSLVAAQDAFHWPNGAKLKVFFLEGSQYQRKTVMAIAKEWSEVCNIYFETTEDVNQAQISIAFGNYCDPGTEKGTWSIVGRSSESSISRNPQKATMNFGWLFSKDDPVMNEWRACVLHEFGHAIGFEHENPGMVPYDMNKVIAMVGKEFAHTNFNFPDGAVRLGSGAWDSDSIMSYTVHENLLIESAKRGDWTNKRNCALSRRDKQLAAKMYPKPDPKQPKTTTTTTTTRPKPAPPPVIRARYSKYERQAGFGSRMTTYWGNAALWWRGGEAGFFTGGHVGEMFGFVPILSCKEGPMMSALHCG